MIDDIINVIISFTGNSKLLRLFYIFNKHDRYIYSDRLYVSIWEDDAEGNYRKFPIAINLCYNSIKSIKKYLFDITNFHTWYEIHGLITYKNCEEMRHPPTFTDKLEYFIYYSFD